MLQKAICLMLMCTMLGGLKAQPGVFKPGDLLFQDLNCGPLCDAIEAVTEGVHGLDFSHVGWVVQVKDSLKVLEAIGSQVQLTRLEDFLKRSQTRDGKPLVVGMRFKKQYTAKIPTWQQKALKLVGKPYDQAFLPHNDSIYCAEVFTETCWQNGKPIFPLQPMTFKDPKTFTYFPAWVAYYQELQQPIPEQILGLNPGAISRSSALYLFYRFGKKVK